MGGRFLTTRNIVWVVASRASQFSFALLKTCREPQPIRCAGNLEFVIVSGVGCMIEVKDEIRQGFAGPIREWPAIKSHNRVRQPETCGFEVTLHAHLELPVCSEPRRIYDRF